MVLHSNHMQVEIQASGSPGRCCGSLARKMVCAAYITKCSKMALQGCMVLRAENRSVVWGQRT